MTNVRSLALEVLNRVSADGYSNILINNVINENKLERNDAALLTEIVYGTIQYDLTLQYYLTPFIKGQKVKGWVKRLLKMSIYQMYFLDKVPNYAIINEAVTIAKKKGGTFLGKFVNGVLRNVERTGIINPSEIKDDIKRLSVKYSHPEWIVKLWIKQYGYDITEKICHANNVHPANSGRINAIENIDEVKNILQNEYGVTQGIIDEAVNFKNINIASTKAYAQGKITIQDESSMLVAHVVNPNEGDFILDTCAAPGGKTTHVAALMNNKGKVIANDIHEHKMKLIRENVERLHLTNIEISLSDATKLHEKYDNNTFDKILIDAPCSGLGVMRRKPEIRYHKNMNDIKEIIAIQKAIIDNTVSLLKPGGILVYSTCTINKGENEDMVNYILKNNQDLSLDNHIDNKLPNNIKERFKDGYTQILPHEFNSDGFFIARFIKQ